jgi:lipopolysaccharide transport system permease protein
MSLRDMQSRYRGSYLGLIWATLTPVCLLAIYTFVFGFVFKARWGERPPNMGEFAIMLFCGIVPFSLLFSDSVSRSPFAVVAQANYVTRVVFPAEALPASYVGSACLQFCAAFIVLLAGALAVRHTLGVAVLLVPVFLVPLILLTAGLTFFLASVGVFIRDMANSVQLAMTLLFFISPVFYRLQNLPPRAQFFMRLNPFTAIIEGFRGVIMPIPGDPAYDWRWYGYAVGMALVVAYLGIVWFMRTKKAFADVL